MGQRQDAQEKSEAEGTVNIFNRKDRKDPRGAEPQIEDGKTRFQLLGKFVAACEQFEM